MSQNEETVNNASQVDQEQQQFDGTQAENVQAETGAAEAEAQAETSTSTQDIDPLVAAQNEVKDLQDKYLRLIAEYDNFKRRTAKERNEYLKTAGKDIIIDLLPVLDDFDRATESIAKATDLEAVKAGFQLVKEKFQKTLEKKGLVELPAKGKDFNADEFEAITEIPAGPEMAGKVVDVVTKGYTLNSSIIRHAQVVVGQRAE